ncbi:NADH-cytochrome b-5 reductase [Parachaetomium inaequale]|uniref:NADH-cytochrome b5 reductase 1 n=1 Tax=Parachaetomium inaequale TaxID=2588326 RepID=A0AAN6SLA1_9PEZI|nr:NADH-cytochrome b-5 reductase [Parachaetomium inaequale]
MSYTLEKVKQHAQPDDVWIVLHNKVYDITKYLEDHPGGSAILIEVAGTDATEAFEDIGHSDEAREQLEPYYIGDLPDEEHADAVEIYRPTFESVSQSAVINVKPTTSSSSPSLTSALLKLGFTGLAGTAAVAAYRQGWTAQHILHELPRLLSSLRLPQGGHHAGGEFWSGVGIASAVQLSLTLGAGLWASSKLDTQEEFTHHAARRPATPARFLRLRTVAFEKTRPSPLDPRQWRAFPLVQKVELAPHVYRFVFALPHADDVLGLPTGQHIALRATIDGQSVARSYTPTSNNTDLGRIELVVKVYDQGAMTKHLERMALGDTIEIRGPKGAMQYSRQYARHIGMIAGGTGITPMYQLIRAICDDEHDTTQVSLLYANNTEADILLRDELDAFAAKCPHKFKLQYVLGHADDTWTGHRGFVSAELIQQYLAPAAAESKVLLCGPPPMINAMKKILQGRGWTMPGLVTKATDQVFLF